jgi:hypothetical protein
MNIAKRNKYGFSVTSGKQDDSCFIGRDYEIRKIHDMFDRLENCVLRADRQHGKTALAHKAIDRYKKEHSSIRLDLSKVDTLSQARNRIIASFVDKILGNSPTINAIIKVTTSTIDTILSKLKGKFKVGDIELALQEHAETDNVISSIVSFIEGLEIIDAVAQAQDKKMIIFLDEVHELIKLTVNEYDNFANKFRALLSESSNLVFIIAGSELKLLREMTTLENRRYLADFTNISVDGIDKCDFSIHLQSACKERGIYLEDMVPSLCSYLTGGIASNLAIFGSKIIDIHRGASEPISINDVIKIAQEYISDNEEELEERKYALTSIDTDGILYSMIASNKYNSLEEDEKMQYDNVLDELVKIGFIIENNDQYFIENPLLLIYCNHKTTAARKRYFNNIIKQGDVNLALLEINIYLPNSREKLLIDNKLT